VLVVAANEDDMYAKALTYVKSLAVVPMPGKKRDDDFLRKLNGWLDFIENSVKNHRLSVYMCDPTPEEAKLNARRPYIAFNVLDKHVVTKVIA
jgi:hypothetical protein